MIKYLKTEDEIWDCIRKGKKVKYARLVSRGDFICGVYEVVDLLILRDSLENLDTTIFFIEIENDKEGDTQ